MSVHSPVSVTVELYGIPRARAGTDRAIIKAATLGDLLAELGNRFPDFASNCLNDSRLQATYLANINGQKFVRNPEHPLQEGDLVMILSADAGG